MHKYDSERIALVVELGIDFFVPETSSRIFQIYSWIISEIGNNNYTILLRPNNQITIILTNMSSDECEYFIQEKLTYLKAKFLKKFKNACCSIGFFKSRMLETYSLKASMLKAEYNMYKERKNILSIQNSKKQICDLIEKFRFFLNSMITGDSGEYTNENIIEASQELDQLIYKHYKL